MTATGRLQGKVALVTGAGQGIGRAIAVRLAREGARLAINGRIAHPKIDAVARETGGLAVVADISDNDQVERMAERVASRLGPVDILVANAAYMNMMPFLEHDAPDWWKQLDVNLTGHLGCIQAVVPGMRRRGGGSIIIIGSIFGVQGWKNASAYAASKSGLSALAGSLAEELRPDNICVNVIDPGVIDTPQLQVDADDLDLSLDEVKIRYARDIPMGRIGNPQEVAAAVAFLAAEGGPIFSGRSLQVNGGQNRCSG
jgi:NAD(P)-dependent dehydrogenase (short-subunit alcohol dehydrogenase family)